MAQRELITKGIKNTADLEAKLYNPSSTEYKELIKELIRLDVPILEIGSSSIGKSYSIRQFMEESGVKGEFLFVGTEKSEFIEGIPNLKEITSGQAKFNYLKPYWFPDKEFIRCRLINGRNQILQKAGEDPMIGGLWMNAKSDYKMIDELKVQLLKYKRTDKEIKEGAKTPCQKIVPDFVVGKYIYEDALLYLSTLQGYGNFWLILDEIDKVEKQDKDKYAPLLHIVRERELKGWKLSGLRDFPEYDVKYVTSIDKRIERLDAALADPKADVTDTRIIAIANDLQTMEEESPALYRRFCKIIIRNSLYDEKQAQLPSGDPMIAVGYDWAKQYELKKQELHSCIVNKQIEQIVESSGPKRSGISQGKSSMSIGQMMAIIEVEKTGKPLDEMNLAWTLGFLPEILFPGADTRGQGLVFVKNKLIENFNDISDPYKTLLFKIVEDNFDVKYWVPLLECIYDKISTKATESKSSSGIDAEVEQAFSEVGLTKDKFNSPNPESVEKLLGKYKTKLMFAEQQFEESIDIQKRQQKGETITDKQLKGVAGGVANISRDAIVFGNVMMQRSMDGKNPTELTRMLISSVPFLQTRFIASPYIPFDGAKDLSAIADDGIANLIYKITGEQKILDQNYITEETKAVFANNIEPYKPFVVKYGIAAPTEDIDALIDGDYKKITNPAETIRKIINNKPVIIDTQLANLLSPTKDKELKKEYLESISNVKILEKEIYQNLSYEVWPMIKNSAEKGGMTPILKEQVKYYAEKFPNTMSILANSITDTPPQYSSLADQFDELKLFIMGIVDSGVQGSEIDTTRKFRDGGMTNGGGVRESENFRGKINKDIKYVFVSDTFDSYLGNIPKIEFFKDYESAKKSYIKYLMDSNNYMGNWTMALYECDDDCSIYSQDNTKKVKNAKKLHRFEGSNRYVDGKIIDSVNEKNKNFIVNLIDEQYTNGGGVGNYCKPGNYDNIKSVSELKKIVGNKVWKSFSIGDDQRWDDFFNEYNGKVSIHIDSDHVEVTANSNLYDLTSEIETYLADEIAKFCKIVSE